MVEWLIIFAIASIPAVLALVLVRFVNVRAATLMSIVLTAASVAWFGYMGLGPHGFILILLLPFWIGCLVAFIICLIAYWRGRGKPVEN